MKLKQLMSNSLPRARSKSKEKSKSRDKDKSKEKEKAKDKKKESTTTTLNNNNLISVASPARPVRPDPINNVRCATTPTGGTTTVGVGVITIPTITPKTKNAVTLNKSLVTDDFNYIEKKIASAGKNDIFNVNFNLNTADAKCACYKHIQPSAYSPEPSKKDKSPCSFGDNNFNSLPRTRTRIRTNPWLPSPKTSPSVSPASSLDTSPADSPTDCKEFDNDTARVNTAADSGQTGGDTQRSHISLNIKAPETDYCSIDSIHKTTSQQGQHHADPLQTSMQQSVYSEIDNSVYATIDEIDSRPQSPYFPIHIEEAEGISSCENISAEIVEKIIDPKHLEDQVSFEYEEAFESQIEAHVDDVLTRDDISDGYGSRDDVFLDSSRFSLGYDSDTERSIESRSLSKESALESYCSDTDEEIIWKLRDDSSGETDDTLCDESDKIKNSLYTSYERRTCKKVPQKSKSSKFGRDGKIMTEINDASSLGSTSADSGACSEGSSLGTCSEGTSLGGYNIAKRSVGEIQSSLQMKVNKLRMEKIIVDEKIRQAQEEERVREHEKMKFQKQLTLHRKQILLRTLQDLKQKLENQSQRLQTTYSSVLGRQKNFLRGQKKYMRAHEIQDFQEAPF